MVSSRCINLPIIGTIMLGCAAELTPVDPQQHRADVEAWKQWRHADLVRSDGWLSLAGLFWLSDGENTFGADPSQDLVFPVDGSPSRIGAFHVEEGTVTIETPGTVGVLHNGDTVTSMIVRSKDVRDSIVLELGTMRWHVIQRGDRFGIRLKDSENAVLTSFQGMEMFPIDPQWRLDARFDRYDPPRTIKVPNILGTVSDQDSPGAVVFKSDGATLRLDVTGEPADTAFFIAFADETNGQETYGGGKFIWVDAPVDGDRMVIDFNKSYNPPCVFTPYATCPLPPRQNRLPLRIEAGEKDFAGKPH